LLVCLRFGVLEEIEFGSEDKDGFIGSAIYVYMNSCVDTVLAMNGQCLSPYSHLLVVATAGRRWQFLVW
jgi:hypothetical protein